MGFFMVKSCCFFFTASWSMGRHGVVEAAQRFAVSKPGMWCHAGHRDLICLEDFEPKRIVLTDDQPPEKTRLVGNPTCQCQVTCQFYGQDMDMGHGSTEGTMMSHCMLLTASFDASLQQVAASVGMMVNWIMGIIPIAVFDFVFGMCYVVMWGLVVIRCNYLILFILVGWYIWAYIYIYYVCIYIYTRMYLMTIK